MAMVELDQMKFELQSYENTLHEVKDSLDLENKERRITELDKSMEEPGFWDDPERSTKTVREAKNLKDTVDGYKHLEQQYEDIQVMIEMGYEENDPAMIPEIQEMLDEFVKELEELRTKTLLSGEYDGCNAILKLNAGAGGTEAMDWCSMLYRMYQRWADKKGFTTEVLDFLDGDEAGLKSITLQVNGENAYGYLCGVTVQGEQVLLVFSVGGHNLSHLLNDTRVLRAHICHHLDDLGHREQIVDHGLIG